MNPSIIQSITFVRTAPCLPVRNIQAALAFYSGVLGFQKTFENGDPVGFVVLKKDAAEIHLSQNREHLATRMNALHMFVDDIRRALPTVRKRKGAHHQIPERQGLRPARIRVC
ncbi:VOC family protein [Kerstersia gyiorum]|uniref:VOC family protein n=1 Tax=Kerstersia gyiorum TaxID=206506 RepID=UPI0020A1C630|nr:VOC family protein [Kerstersia gyiorum]MCP1669990.1 catechol 2,3-dioxygenase-like lactoylglutathione lyase family enzyme [Kerstersia gyiorum]MCP1707895.1 catechol 2,3-dioxygenase-like lactoylglutathione lyase family enzyme [Kerstersia gyiorum]